MDFITRKETVPLDKGIEQRKKSFFQALAEMIANDNKNDIIQKDKGEQKP